MNSECLVEQLLATTKKVEQERLLQAHILLFDDQAAEALKNQAVQLRMTNTKRALRIANLILYAARLTGKAQHKGYGLWAEAVVRSLGLGEYERALACYDKAIVLFEREGDSLSPAIMQVSRLWSLANLNRHAEAFAVGEAAGVILKAHQRWLPLATLHMNLANVYTRVGEYAKALTMFEHAQGAYEAQGEMNAEVEGLWASAVNNCALSLCYLGRFAESIQASQLALNTQERLGNWIEAARVRQVLAITYFMLGRYTEALKLLEQARETFLADDLRRHAARVDLYICDCLLSLRRFERVLEKSPQLRLLFQKLKAPHEEGLALLYQAIAYVGLQKNQEALAAFAEARQLFVTENSPVWIAHTDLETSTHLYRQGQFAESISAAQSCAAIFYEQALVIKEAEAHLVMAQALIGLERYAEARVLLDNVNRIGTSKDVPSLIYQVHYLCGKLARVEENLAETYAEYEQAVAALERLRGRLVVEFRVNFQEDKQVLYEDLVELCLDMNRPELALTYAERAKSRALLDLLDYRVDLRIQVKHAADRPLVEKLMQLRAKRDQLCRYLENHEQAKERAWVGANANEQDQQALLHLEKQIAELWDTLLIRNADYAQDAALWHLSNEPLQLDLEPDTLLIEYFAVHDKLIVFLVTKEGITTQRFPVDFAQVKPLIERLHRHMQTVHEFPAAQLPQLVRQAQFFLQKLYTILVAPFAQALAPYENKKLIFVPHGVLHYLPFHALYDGQAFLIERHEISYLPNASLLRFCQAAQTAASGMVALGYSAQAQLPHTQAEARTIAELFAGDLLLEKDATLKQVQTHAPNKQLLHLATHAKYDDSQPLFSGLLLADGWLTTLDIFHLKLNAALVTLSACQTGRSVIGGGDELLGLMRAFFYAGASSLLLSMWPVEDQSTAEFMQLFYAKLKQGESKSRALCDVQRHFIRKQEAATSPAHYAHPYFWASFFLTGDPSPLVLNSIL